MPVCLSFCRFSRKRFFSFLSVFSLIIMIFACPQTSNKKKEKHSHLRWIRSCLPRNLSVADEFGGVENSVEWVFLNNKESFKFSVFFYHWQPIALYDFYQLHSSIYQEVIYGWNARKEETELVNLVKICRGNRRLSDQFLCFINGVKQKLRHFRFGRNVLDYFWLFLLVACLGEISESLSLLNYSAFWVLSSMDHF